MTLIQVGTRRRCDARCYDARHPKCDCVCGGANHGVGLDKAVHNTRVMAQAMVEKATDDTYAWRCLAYDEDGHICGRKAVLIDREGGYPVCALHAGARQAQLSGVKA